MVRIEIKSDRFTKVVLAVIAGCLVSICLGRTDILSPAQGQPASQPTMPQQSSRRITTTANAEKPLGNSPVNRVGADTQYKQLSTQSLFIVDEDGKRHGAFEASRDGCELHLFGGDAARNSNSPCSVDLRVSNDGAASVCLGGYIPKSDGGFVPSSSISLFRFGDDSVSMVLADKNRKERICVQLGSDGSPSVIISDESQYRAILGVALLETTKTGATEKTSPSSLTLFDKNFKVFWKTP